eukprot:CAMPEP_0182857086 /NCGR_PEP_ID=MMETSP0034_2-20130328/2841_1 /TAXON_ID=156128 /ORGANISM="Nephroselmis pyriformis, Strain CCMP717" /LENGTH=455 /DNA_ID=CAMNT_0024988283 /DNA_START=40 /DNA_END=1407 /DNA_ORIENTATION=+
MFAARQLAARTALAASRSFTAFARTGASAQGIAPAVCVPLARKAIAMSGVKRDASGSIRGYAADAWTDGNIVPHGGKLVDLMVTDAAAKEKLIASCEGRTIECSDRNACDVELLCVGGFSPLEGFMGEDAYTSVVENMRLPGSNLLFGLPIVMDTRREDLVPGMNVLLTYKGQNLAVMEIDAKWVPNKAKEALNCYRTSSLEHPGVHMIATERGQYYLGGKVHGFELPTRVFPCQSPKEVRAQLPAGADVVAFQCRNPVHRAHYELFTRALDAENVRDNAVCLVHPTCGPTQDDDIPGIVRYQTYEVLAEEVNNRKIRWAYLPYSMHMAGPREAIQHMMIRKNYGCTHFIIGRDMAGSKSSISGDDFYGAYDAQDFAKEHAGELGMKTVPSLNVVYTEEEGYVTADVADAKKLTAKKLSGTKFRQMLRAGDEIPEWFAFKSVVKVLRDDILKQQK